MISFKEPQFITGTSLIIISTEEYRELLALTEELEDFLAVEKDKDEEIESIDLFERLKEYRKKKYKNSQKYSVDSDDLKEIITTPMPYGMYKDKMLIDLPFNYLEWLNDKGFFNGKIGKLLAITFEIKKIDKTLL